MKDTQSKSVGTLIDELYELRSLRLEKQKEVDELKTTETKITEEIMGSLQALDMTSGKGKVATFSYKPFTVPKLVDFNALKEYILKTGNLQLFERRVSNPAWQELFQLEGSVPGIEPYTFDKPSLTRSKK
jgi:hypothetical protein